MVPNLSEALGVVELSDVDPLAVQVFIVAVSHTSLKTYERSEDEDKTGTRTQMKRAEYET